MSKEMQIEEISKILCGMKNGCDGCMFNKVHCNERNYAEEIYAAGYRKQSNLIEEFTHRAIDLSVCKDNGDGTERLFVSTENLRKIAQVMKGGE